MRQSLAFFIVTALVSACPAETQAGWFGPSNFDECVLENMKGVTNDLAARQIRQSCQNKFPADQTAGKAKDILELPDSALRNLDVEMFDPRSAESKYAKENNSSQSKPEFVDPYTDTQVIHLHNGNSDWSLCSVVIRITDTQNNTHRDYQAVHSPNYLDYLKQDGVGCDGKPLSADTMEFEFFEKPEFWTWKLMSAKGMRQK